MYITRSDQSDFKELVMRLQGRFYVCHLSVDSRIVIRVHIFCLNV